LLGRLSEVEEACSRILFSKRKAVPHLKGPASRDGISIVVPNYNGMRYFDTVIPSFFAALRGFEQSEVLVVDDVSSDGSVEYLREKYPAVRLIALDKNVGFGRACNVGITNARHRAVYLLNSDIILEQDGIGPMLESLEKEDTFAVTPKLYLWDFVTFHSGINAAKMNSECFPVWNEANYVNTPVVEETSPTFYAIGAAMFVDKEKFLQLGGFDPIYVPYCWEDIDICYRAWKRGWRVLYEPTSIAYHKSHGTLADVTKPTAKLAIECKNSLLFMLKNIHDKRLLGFHLEYVARCARAGLDNGTFEYYDACKMVLRQLSSVLRGRMRERRYARVQDAAIFALTYDAYSAALRRKGIEVAGP